MNDLKLSSSALSRFAEDDLEYIISITNDIYEKLCFNGNGGNYLKTWAFEQAMMIYYHPRKVE